MKYFVSLHAMETSLAQNATALALLETNGLAPLEVSHLSPKLPTGMRFKTLFSFIFLNI